MRNRRAIQLVSAADRLKEITDDVNTIIRTMLWKGLPFDQSSPFYRVMADKAREAQAIRGPLHRQVRQPRALQL